MKRKREEQTENVGKKEDLKAWFDEEDNYVDEIPVYLYPGGGERILLGVIQKGEAGMEEGSAWLLHQIYHMYQTQNKEYGCMWIHKPYPNHDVKYFWDLRGKITVAPPPPDPSEAGEPFHAWLMFIFRIEVKKTPHGGDLGDIRGDQNGGGGGGSGGGDVGESSVGGDI